MSGLGREEGARLLREMVRIRRFEERCGELYQQEKIRGFLHLYIGEEAIAVGVMDALGPDDDVLATYREHGHALARGVGMNEVMAEMYGKAEGSSGGRGGSMHIFDVGKRFFGGNAIVGGHLPLAVGMGLAHKMRGEQAIAVCFFGEGAVAEGEFHESLNLAALWGCPVLFCCENNLYAMGTALARSEAQTTLIAKAPGYNVPALSVDGMDLVAVRRAARAAVKAVREGGGPFLLELKTYRFRAHSMFDAQLYRDKSEVEGWKDKDPIPRFIAELTEEGLIDGAAVAAIEDEVAREVAAAVAFAEAGSWEPVETLTRFVTTEPGDAGTGRGA